MDSIFPVIDPEATGRNIIRLRTERHLTVRDLQAYFGFAEPNAIYHWQNGKTLPSVDNLFALSQLLNVPMNDILVAQPTFTLHEQQAASCCSSSIYKDTIYISLCHGSNTSMIFSFWYFCRQFFLSPIFWVDMPVE